MNTKQMGVQRKQPATENEQDNQRSEAEETMITEAKSWVSLRGHNYMLP
jgi:hypothetical protein